jgi:cobalt/nickel transport system permease protein
VQCFLFADGGVLALGANVFNMAIVGAAGGYGIYKLAATVLPGARGRVAAVAFAGWCSTVLASVFCAGQLAWSRTVAWPVAFTAMAGVHMLIGLGEGLISALAFVAIQRIRPELVGDMAENGQAPLWNEFARYGLLAAIGVALFVAPFACSWPDGLERVAATLGFEDKATRPVLVSPAPGYHVPGIHWAAGATALAGAAGAVIVFGLALVLARSLVHEE